MELRETNTKLANKQNGWSQLCICYVRSCFTCSIVWAMSFCNLFWNLFPTLVWRGSAISSDHIVGNLRWCLKMCCNTLLELLCGDILLLHLFGSCDASTIIGWSTLLFVLFVVLVSWLLHMFVAMFLFAIFVAVFQYVWMMCSVHSMHCHEMCGKTYGLCFAAQAHVLRWLATMVMWGVALVCLQWVGADTVHRVVDH